MVVSMQGRSLCVSKTEQSGASGQNDDKDEALRRRLGWDACSLESKGSLEIGTQLTKHGGSFREPPLQLSAS